MKGWERYGAKSYEKTESVLLEKTSCHILLFIIIEDLYLTFYTFIIIEYIKMRHTAHENKKGIDFASLWGNKLLRRIYI